VFAIIVLAIIIGLIWLEILVFGAVGGEIGVVLTIIGVFVTAAIGIRLFRVSGPATLKRMAESAAQGHTSLTEVADGAAVMLAAIMLLIPGYATDLLGFVLFIPGVRTSIMVFILTFLGHIAPNRKGFIFTMHNINQGMPGEDTSFNEDQHEKPLHDGEDASTTTIEGDYKRHD
jgi:UPF0716 family protein affecting phage T7 exclusion